MVGLVGDPTVSLFWTMHTIMKLKYCLGTYKTNFYTGWPIKRYTPFSWFLPKSHDHHTHRNLHLKIDIYEYSLNWLKICLKAISGLCYLHSGSILLNCTIVNIFLGLHFCKVPWMNKNVDWYVLSEWWIQSSKICLIEKLFAFVQLLHEWEYFLDIEHFCLQISFLWYKIVWCILHFA